jgi:redox-sensitive bicupin YhaK (pirin superfamily)
MGAAATIAPGEVQRRSAGTGITHSEFNYRTAAHALAV